MKRGRPLTILLDGDDLACIEARCREALDGTLLAFDLNIHLRLLDRGLEHITVWDILERTDEAAIEAFEREAWEFWHRHAGAVFEGLDLLDMARYRHEVCFGRLAWAGFALDKALRVLQPGEVVVFEETTGHGLDQPIGYNKMPLLFAMLRGLAEDAGIPTRVLSRADLPGQQGFVDATARLGRAPQGSADAEDALRCDPLILFYGYDAELLRQRPLVEALRNETPFQVLQLYKWASPQVSRRLQDMPGVVHESQVTSGTSPPEIAALAAESRRVFERARRGAPDQLRGIFANRYMDMHFDFIFGEYLRKMAWHVRAWRALLTRHRPALLVLNTPFPIYDVACDMGIPALALPHGLTLLGQPKVMFSLARSHVAAMGAAHRDRLVAGGVAADHVHVIGDPHLDHLAGRSASRGKRGQVHFPISEAPARRKMHLSPFCHSVLLLTANMGRPAGYHGIPLVNWKRAARCFEQLGALAARRTRWRFTIRCHPRSDHPALYERINRGLPGDACLQITSDGDLLALAREHEVVVLCHNMTSALMECSLAHRPVIIWDEGLMWYDPQSWNTQGWPHVRSTSDLEAELHHLFGDPQAYDQRVRQTAEALTHYLGEPLQPAIPRCRELIEELTPAQPSAVSPQPSASE